MGAFTDLSDFVNRMTGGNSGAPENIMFHKHSSYGGGTATAVLFVLTWSSTWRWDGVPNAGAVAAAVATCDKSTTGALQFTNSAGSATKRLVQAIAACHDIGSNGTDTILLVDRLLAVGGLSGTVTTAQTVGGTLSRYTGGIGNQIWIEIQTAIGLSGTPTVTASYTNESGTAGRTTAARRIGNTAGYNEIHCALNLPLQAGDLGVQSVQSITLSSTTGTAGDIAVVIYHPMALLPSQYVALGPFGSLGTLPEIVDNACLTFLVSQNTTRRAFQGTLCMVDV